MNEYTNKGYIVVSDYIPADCKDVSDILQNLIEQNPNRTLFFPDGTYPLSKPVCTPADPQKSVDLQLSNFAVICPTEDWKSEEAMIRLGAICSANNIYMIGSNYSLTGGILDGHNIASGVSIDGGRETAIRNVSIKHTRIGIHVKFGANSGSSDADIMNVNIVGTGKTDSVGVLVEGYDNSFTNMRIANVFYGFDIHSAGNVLKNIHPLYTEDYTNYAESCAFMDRSGNNWYNFCYSDQFGIGFRFTKDGRCTLESCFCYWYTARGKQEIVLKADGKFRADVEHIKSGFRGDLAKQGDGIISLLQFGEAGGCGVIVNPAFDPNIVTDDFYKDYLQGKVV